MIKKILIGLLSAIIIAYAAADIFIEGKIQDAAELKLTDFKRKSGIDVQIGGISNSMITGATSASDVTITQRGSTYTIDEIGYQCNFISIATGEVEIKQNSKTCSGFVKGAELDAEGILALTGTRDADIIAHILTNNEVMPVDIEFDVDSDTDNGTVDLSATINVDNMGSLTSNISFVDAQALLKGMNLKRISKASIASTETILETDGVEDMLARFKAKNPRAFERFVEGYNSYADKTIAQARKAKGDEEGYAKSIIEHREAMKNLINDNDDIRITLTSKGEGVKFRDAEIDNIINLLDRDFGTRAFRHFKVSTDNI